MAIPLGADGGPSHFGPGPVPNFPPGSVPILHHHVGNAIAALLLALHHISGTQGQGSPAQGQRMPGYQPSGRMPGYQPDPMIPADVSPRPLDVTPQQLALLGGGGGGVAGGLDAFGLASLGQTGAAANLWESRHPYAMRQLAHGQHPYGVPSFVRGVGTSPQALQ